MMCELSYYNTLKTTFVYRIQSFFLIRIQTGQAELSRPIYIFILLFCLKLINRTYILLQPFEIKQ